MPERNRSCSGVPFWQDRWRDLQNVSLRNRRPSAQGNYLDVGTTASAGAESTFMDEPKGLKRFAMTAGSIARAM
jgi:hypothetical protein